MSVYVHHLAFPGVYLWRPHGVEGEDNGHVVMGEGRVHTDCPFS